MAEPVFFVVQRGIDGRETPSLCYSVLPRDKRRLVYACRLDLLPHGDDWAGLSIKELWRTYQALKRHGKLPPSLGQQ